MKKYLFLLIAAVSATAVMAQPGQGSQTEIMKLKTADGQIIRYEVSNVSELSFGALFHAFDGYILADGKYFNDYYAGSVSKLSVYQAAEGYDIHISDPVWGEAEFENVTMTMGKLEGSGKIIVSQQYGGSTYDATISGAMTTPVITIPSLMQSGTTLTFHLGEVPQAVLVKGSHKGSVSVMVGDSYGPYVNSDVTYTVTANEDGTINVVIPEYTLDNTQIGNLTLGTYTISNIAYDEEKGAFYRDYTGDDLSFHFKVIKDGNTTMDNDYTFTQLGNITVKSVNGTITIENNFQPGKMPFPITSTYTKAQGGAHTR